MPGDHRDYEEVTLTGTLWAGKFDVVDRLGEGAMGTVYRARHIPTNEWVALKRLHPEHADDDEVVARFNREMEATARVQHPNTARVVDYGAEEGYLFLAMEVVEGRSLEDVIVDECPMEPERIAHIGRQIADALAAAHEIGFVHRDLKPENIMIQFRDGDPDFVKVLDFGLAGILDEQDEARLTGHGLRVGTPLYMAPEYIEGKETDHRSDLYALGVVLYMMAVGKAPYLGTPYAILQKAVTEDPPRPSEVLPDGCAPWLESTILKLMAKDPEDRIQTASEVSRRLVAGREAAAQPTGRTLPPAIDRTATPVPDRPQRVIPMSTAVLIVFAAVVLALIGFGLGLTLM